MQADLSQKLEQIPEQSGEPRKATIRQAEHAADEASELLDQMRLEKGNIPSAARAKVNQRFRNFETDLDASRRKLKALADDRKALFGDRYSDNPGADVQLEQRQQLLSGTERLGRSSDRLRESQRIANETEQIGAGTLADLHGQRSVIEHTRGTLLESEGYVDRSVKTLRSMARRWVSCRAGPGTQLTRAPQDGYQSDNHRRHHHGAGAAHHRRHRQQVPLGVGSHRRGGRGVKGVWRLPIRACVELKHYCLTQPTMIVQSVYCERRKPSTSTMPRRAMQCQPNARPQSPTRRRPRTPSTGHDVMRSTEKATLTSTPVKTAIWRRALHTPSSRSSQTRAPSGQKKPRTLPSSMSW